MALLRDRYLSSAFDDGAAFYDRFVSLNPGYHSQLRRSARRLRLPRDGYGLRVLDLGCGTGASTAALLHHAPHARVTAVDASAGMLRQARAKSWPGRVEFVHATAEELPAEVTDTAYDAVFAAYLFRNVPDPDAVLTTVRGLLAPGGRLAVHEYTLTGARAHRALWDGVCWGGVIPLGALRGDGPLYRHLWQSVVAFDTAGAFRDRVRSAGFEQVRVLPTTGWQWGVVHTVLGAVPHGTAAATPKAATTATVPAPAAAPVA
ncbi:class I SAM-dependent methyltransferase, partial [Streptomyces sparsus]